MSTIPKSELIHGMYYHGHCRNATVARWHAPLQRFIHWRYKFGHEFLEAVPHIEDVLDTNVDGFTPEGWIRPVPDALFENYGKEPQS